MTVQNLQIILITLVSISFNDLILLPFHSLHVCSKSFILKRFIELISESVDDEQSSTVRINWLRNSFIKTERIVLRLRTITSIVGGNFIKQAGFISVELEPAETILRRIFLPNCSISFNDVSIVDKNIDVSESVIHSTCIRLLSPSKNSRTIDSGVIDILF
ncbi:hypothetical protein DERP_000709 [Dermatophagoides pteronyssinus]|uniref:Uncharacterized protein n=1 Tax=Dermatophagoides pteronyssinus TaxID=6956 RepID=A0ABQ8J0W8_DERPT|nr:hypothetical protein DERP_000709 [Dermatophagoides pteronyssinus]